MSAPQAPRKLTIVDMVYLQGLKKELAELKQKKPQPEGLAEKVKNFEACISYIASHGVTTQDSYLLYANGGKAIVEKADNFLTKTAPKGTLYNARANLCIVYPPDSELMTGGGSGSDPGSASTVGTPAEQARKISAVPPPNAKELKELPKDMQPESDTEFMNYAMYLPGRPNGTSRPMHQLYLQIRLADADGGSPDDTQVLTIYNDTGCSAQVILESDFQKLLGFREGQNGRPVRPFTGKMGRVWSHTAGGMVSRRKIYAYIRVCKTADGRTPLREQWDLVQVNIAADDNAFRFSGNAMRKNLVFATPAGNSCLFVSPSRRAIAWQILRF